MRKTVILVTLLIAGLVLISCAKALPPTPPTPPTPPVSTPPATGAAALFTNNCAVCHGANRQGISGLGSALTPTSLARLSDDEVRNTILKGRPNTAMAGFEGRLGSEEIDSLVQFIKYSSP